MYKLSFIDDLSFEFLFIDPFVLLKSGVDDLFLDILNSMSGVCDFYLGILNSILLILVLILSLEVAVLSKCHINLLWTLFCLFNIAANSSSYFG